jgi:hypothetical protein
MYRIVSPIMLASDSGLGFPLTSIQAMRESSIKTLVKHLKIKGLIEATKIGTRMTEKGRKVFSEVLSLIPTGNSIAKCFIASGKFNHAVLVKGLSFAVKLGIEQRDGGALGGTTLLFNHAKFAMPDIATADDSTGDSLKNPKVPTRNQCSTSAYL